MATSNEFAIITTTIQYDWIEKSDLFDFSTDDLELKIGTDRVGNSNWQFLAEDYFVLGWIRSAFSKSTW